MAKHTQTPWSYDGKKSPWILGPVGDEADRCLVARINLCPLNPDCRAEVGCGSIDPVANGEFIVRACNSHDELLAACMEARAHGQHTDQCGWWDSRHKQGLMHFDGVCDCWLSRANAAVAKAGE